MDNKKELHGVLTTMLGHTHTKVVDYNENTTKKSVTLKLAGKGNQEMFSLRVNKYSGSHNYELKFAHSCNHNTNYLDETLTYEESETALWIPLLEQVDALYADRNYLRVKNSLDAFNDQFGD